MGIFDAGWIDHDFGKAERAGDDRGEKYAKHCVESWFARLALSLPVVILLAAPTHSQPWGWWDDDDSLARPTVLGDTLDRMEGRFRVSATSSDEMRRSRLDYDASARADAWSVAVAGRDDSGLAPAHQRASWTGNVMSIQIGDLAPWRTAPLLEGGSRPSGEGHPLRRLGSGSAPAGIDVAAEEHVLLPWPVAIRSRISSSPRGTPRSSMLASCGALRAGLTSSRGRASFPSAGLRLDVESSRLEADLLADRDAFGFVASIESAAEGARHAIEVRHVDRALAHDGLPEAWAGSTRAQAESRWSIGASSLGLSADAESDSCGRNTTRLLGDASQDLAGWEARMRARWTPSSTRELRLTPGASRTSGSLRPWIEATWISGGSLSPSLGARWIGRDLHLDVSATRRNTTGWRWRTASSLGRERDHGGSRFEITVSGSRNVQQGGGTWTTNW